MPFNQLLLNTAKRSTTESIDEKAVSSRLYTGEMPDPDLVIRTSGEGVFPISYYGKWLL